MSAGDAIYLDHAAATPMDSRVLEAMQPFFRERFYNPSATYTAALETKKALEAARAEAGHWLGAKPSEIIFTAGGTEANNVAIQGIMRRFPDANIVISAIEHESVLAPAKMYRCQEAVVRSDGRIDVGALAVCIDDQTVLVSVMYANNEIGTVEPIHDIGQLVGEIREQRRVAGNKLPLYFHTDAAQATNFLDLHVARLGVDLMTLNGGKIYGPKQSGILYVKAGTVLEPLILGGGQERGIRSGTENVAAAIGFAEALKHAQDMRHKESPRLQKLQTQFITGIEKNIPTATINGSMKYRLPNNVHVTFDGKDNERLLIELDEAGIMAAAGSACSASSEESSHVLHSLGLSDDAARASIRFTMGRNTDEAAIEKTLDVLRKITA